jgi:hypothetical protein
MAEKDQERASESFEDEKAKDEFNETIIRSDEEGGDSPDALEFKKKEAQLVKKLDTFIAPVMFLLMLISYLDRG